MIQAKMLIKSIVLPIGYGLILLLLYFLKQISLEFAIYFLIGSLIAVVLLISDQMYLHKLYREPDLPLQLVTRSPLFQ